MNLFYTMIEVGEDKLGPVNELGVFAMTEKGLKEVNNPSAIYLSLPTGRGGAWQCDPGHPGGDAAPVGGGSGSGG